MFHAQVYIPSFSPNEIYQTNMSVLVGFSIIAPVSLLIIIIFYILCHDYSKLVCPTIIATQLKWAWDLLLYHSFSFHKYCCEHELPNMSEELNIVWSELMQGSSCEEEEVECAVYICKLKMERKLES